MIYIFYLDSKFDLTFQFLPCESVGKIIKKLILESHFQDNLNEKENSIYLQLKAYNDQKRQKRQKAINTRWEKRKAEQKQQTQKEQKGDLPKRDLPIQQTNFKKSIYNNYKQLPSQNTQQTQKEKDFIKEYQSRGTLTI